MVKLVSWIPATCLKHIIIYLNSGLSSCFYLDGCNSRRREWYEEHYYLFDWSVSNLGIETHLRTYARTYFGICDHFPTVR